jgi:hypothetical protein
MWQGVRSHSPEKMGGVSERSTGGHADDAGVPVGTYFDANVRRVGVVGCTALFALGGVAALLGFVGEIPWVDAILALLTGLIGAGWVWSWTVRPRLEIGRRGLIVVNPVRTIEVNWAEVDSFDCHHSLSVCRSDGSNVVVAALPANGLRRIIGATPGRVDRLAIRLNAYVANRSAPGTTPARTSIETPKGRRDLRVLAGIAVLGTGATAVIRHLIG